MKTDQFNQKNVEPEVEKHTSQKPVDNLYFDMSEGLAIEMFGFSPSSDNEVRFIICLLLASFDFSPSKDNIPKAHHLLFILVACLFDEIPLGC